jgi:hypothetical protein
MRLTFDNGVHVTVHSLVRPIKSPPSQELDPGYELLAIDFEHCVGDMPAGATVSSNPLDVQLVMTDNTRVMSTSIAIKPTFLLADLQAGDCNRGLITFEVPVGIEIQRIEFSGYTHDYEVIRGRWTME